MKLKKAAAALAVAFAVNAAAVTAFADNAVQYKTKDQAKVYAVGQYSNWDGVSTTAQFIGTNGELCYAYDGSKYVTVVRTKNGKTLKNRIQLEKKHPLFGTVTCDEKGNYYLVTGETNNGSNRSTSTVFISKYDKNGKHIKTTGDDGSSSLAYYYDDSFNTKIPFDGGCCDAAVNGNILTVNYGREMYSGHQSNSVFTVNTDTMTTIKINGMYNSHSFAQRVIPFKNGFVYLSEGDCYPRAFTVDYADFSANLASEYDIFHFWVKKNALSNWDMFALNNNFAHAGGLVNINDKTVAMVGTSVKSLSSDANNEKEQLFIQIFDPTKDLTKSSSYVTSGTRSGTGGPDGNESVTDYGVMWLTSYGKTTTVSEPQAAVTDDGKIVVLYEASVSNKYRGVYYIVLDSEGNVLQDSKLYSKTAKLNSCEMPVFANGKVYWAANSSTDSKNIYIYSLEIE
ncbi:MAG: hypothetical protein NC253_04670 [Ruminococcus sp.]|nr:hypothetical protein [Ruminococcus sp.]MCM1381544.1 hypothetical protein [Muribaculaceae bacterium]MCM1478784.1 hypothetical protein [Muribaculaceae bacterium]